MERRGRKRASLRLEETCADDARNDPSPWGLEWSDVIQIRERLQLTPTERLRAAQDFMNTALRIRAQNGG